MTLVNVRATFEQSLTDKITEYDPSIIIFYDNTLFTTPSSDAKYVRLSLTFSSSTLQNLGPSVDYYTGFITCSIFVPKSEGTATFSAITEVIIDGLTAVNALTFVDSYNCNPRVRDVVGPTPIDLDDRSHFQGTLTCQFSATP